MCVPAFARLRFVKARACVTDLLCMMTDAKHRVRSTRGARGSNPSQKTPRQRGAVAPSTHFARSARCVASYSKARFKETRKLTRNTAKNHLFCLTLATRRIARSALARCELGVSAFARLRFLRSALHKGRHGLFVLTDAKHRVRSKHHGRALQATRYGGARGSNPSQKTPRQRGA